MIGIGLGPRRLRFVCLLILLSSLILYISVSAPKAKLIGNVLTSRQNVALISLPIDAPNHSAIPSVMGVHVIAGSLVLLASLP